MDPEEELRREAARRRGYDTAEDVAASEARKGPAAHSTEGIPFGGSERVRAIAEAHPEHAPSLPESLDRAIGEALGPGDALARVPRAVRRVGTALASTPAAPAAEYGAQWLESGTAPTSGAVTGATSGLADEIAGLVGGAAEVSRGGDFVPGYERRRDAVRARARRDEEEHPTAFGAGEAGGALAQGLLIPGSGATTAAGRMAAATGTGAGLGALSAFGHSERTGGELLHDTAAGGLAGGVGGAFFGGLGETGRAGANWARDLSNRADRLRVASWVGNGTSPLSIRSMEELGALPGGFSGVAERGRRLLGPTRFARAADVETAASAARDRVGRELGGHYAAVDRARPGGVPVSRFTEALEGVRDRAAASPGRVPYAPAIDSRIADWEAAAASRAAREGRFASGAEDALTGPPVHPGLRSGGTLPGPAAREALEDARQGVNFVAANEGETGAEVAGDAYRSLRGAYNDLAEEALPGSRDEIRRLATDYATIAPIADFSRLAALREIRRGGMLPGFRANLMAQMLGMGDNPLARLAAAAATEEGIGRSASAHATGAEAVRGILRRIPEGLTESAEPLLRGVRRAGTSLLGGSMGEPEEATVEEAGDAPDRTMTAAEIDALFDEDEGARPMTAEEIDALFDEEGTDR